MSRTSVLGQSIQDYSPLGKVHRGVLEEVVQQNLQGSLAENPCVISKTYIVEFKTLALVQGPNEVTREYRPS